MRKTITITDEMLRHSIGYRLALRYMTAARTEASAQAWARAVDRHRMQLGWLLDDAIMPVADEVVKRIVDESMSIAIAVPGEEADACAE